MADVDVDTTASFQSDSKEEEALVSGLVEKAVETEEELVPMCLLVTALKAGVGMEEEMAVGVGAMHFSATVSWATEKMVVVERAVGKEVVLELDQYSELVARAAERAVAETEEVLEMD